MRGKGVGSGKTKLRARRGDLSFSELGMPDMGDDEELYWVSLSRIE